MTSRYLSKVNLTPSGGVGTVVTNSIDCYITSVTGNVGAMYEYYNNATIRLVYRDGTFASMAQGGGGFNFSNPNPEKYVKKIEFYNTFSWGNVTITNLRIYPVQNQERSVDINLATYARSATYVSLVSNYIDQSAVSYSILSGQWTSEKFTVGLKHQIPHGTSITGIRIFLQYPPDTEDLSGADLQAYSLRCWE